MKVTTDMRLKTASIVRHQYCNAVRLGFKTQSFNTNTKNNKGSRPRPRYLETKTTVSRTPSLNVVTY